MKKLFTAILITGLVTLNSYAALIISNSVATTLTTTSMVFNATIASTNGTGTNPTCTVFYGTVDYTTNASSWAYSNVYGVSGIGNISTQITGLSASHKYYFAWRAVEGTNTDWATPSLNAWTKPLAPTSTPAVVTISVQTDTAGDLKAPINLWAANSNDIKTAIGFNGDTDTNAVWGNISGTLANQLDLTSTVAKAASAVATNDVSVTNARPPEAHNQGYATITNAPWLTNVVGYVATNDVSVTNARPPEAHNQGYATITNAPWLTNVVGYVATNDVSVTNARPWNSPNYNTITNPPTIPSTNTLASTNWVVSQGYVTNSITNMLSDGSIVWTSSGGPQPSGSVTNAVKGWSHYAPTQAVDFVNLPLTNVAYIKISTNLAIGSNLTQPTGIGAINAGTVEAQSYMTASGIGAMNRGKLWEPGGVLTETYFQATGNGAMNMGEARGANCTVLASGIGALNMGYAYSDHIANSGNGSIALMDDSGNITITHNAAIVMGNGTSSEDRSILADVVRARVNFIGNGAGLTNLSLAETLWTAASNNVVYTNTSTYTQAVAQAAAALPASSTNTFKVTALMITGSPTNGAVYLCTNTTTGAGKWSGPVGFGANGINGQGQTFSNDANTKLRFNSIVFNYGNAWDGTNFIAPVNGIYAAGYSVQLYPASPGLVYAKFSTNDVLCGGLFQFVTGSRGAYANTLLYMTNGARLNFIISSTLTNATTDTPANDYAWGYLVREIP